MRPPDEVFPSRKKIQFDKTGRPFHYMFFTRFPHYYEMCHVSPDFTIKTSIHPYWLGSDENLLPILLF